MLKVAVYGNCQAEALQRILSYFPEQFNVVALRPVHLLDRNQPQELYSKIREVDYFLYQPVSAGYGDLASNAVIDQLQSSATAISFPSIYFDAFQCRQIYLRDPGGARISSPIGDYHDDLIVNMFLRGASCKDIVAALDGLLMSREDCEANLAQSLNYFSARESTLDIKLSQYIRDNYFQKLLFYTFNHPSNEILFRVFSEFLCLADIRKLGQPNKIINLDRDFLSNYYFQSDLTDPGVFAFQGFQEYGSNRTKYTREDVVSSYLLEYSRFGHEKLAVAYEYSLRRRLKVLSNQLAE